MSGPPRSDNRSRKQPLLGHSDVARARSWILDIAAVLVPGPVRDDPADRQFPGGLRVHRSSGAWFHHGHGKGGYDVVPLVALLQGYGPTEALTWVQAWLVAHPGRGGVSGAETDDTELDELSLAASEAALQRAQTVLEALIPLEEIAPGAVYLRKRGIANAFPDWLKWLPPNVMRYGEGAVAALLESGDAIVGVQVTYVTARGAKSKIEPVRQTFLRERSARSQAATFNTLPDPAKPPARKLLIAEGAEDVLSLLQALPEHVTVGVPGVAGIARLTVAKGTEIVLCRDGDEKDSPADKALLAGVDHLLLQGATVTVTAPELDNDNNDVLVKHGADALRALVEAAAPVALSLDGEAARCARLDEGVYEQQRQAVAKRLGVRVKILDLARQRAQRKWRQAEAKARAAGPLFLGEPDLCTALDAGLNEIKRYVVAKDYELAVALLWVVLTHLVHNVHVSLQRCFILKVQAPTVDSGKSTFCELLATLVPRAEPLSSYTAASIVRAYQAADLTGSGRPTLILDEGDQALPLTEALVQILNASTRRKLAVRAMAVKQPDGTFGVEKVNLFGPILLSGNGASPISIASREIRILLRRALVEDVKEKLIADTTPELEAINAELAAWSAEQLELEDPELPDWLRRRSGRTAGNWLQLLAVALKAGGQWPALLQEAAEAEFTREPEVTRLERLLVSVRKAFITQPKIQQGNGTAVQRAADDQGRIRTETLVAELNRDPEEQWNRANGGQPVDAYFLREAFRNLLTPPGARQWEVTVGGTRLHCRGYGVHQFDELCRQYGVKILDIPALGEEGSQASPPDAPAAPPDDPPDGSMHPVAQQSASEAGSSDDPPDPPDPPDEIGGQVRMGEGVAVSAATETVSDPAAALIKTTSAAHPTWSIDKLAKHLRQPKALVRAVLQPDTGQPEAAA